MVPDHWDTSHCPVEHFHIHLKSMKTYSDYTIRNISVRKAKIVPESKAQLQVTIFKSAEIVHIVVPFTRRYKQMVARYRSLLESLTISVFDHLFHMATINI